MDIITTISDLCLAYAMFVLIIHYAVKDASNPAMAAVTTTPIVILVMIPIFTILYPMRYLIAAVELVYLAWMRVRQYKDVVHPLKEIRKYYSDQVTQKLTDVEIVWIDFYGLEARPTNKSLPQAYLFIDYNSYFRLLEGQTISHMRWEILEVAGKPDSILYRDRLFLILFLEGLEAQKIALAMRIGDKSITGANDEPLYKASYIWTLMLKDVLIGAELKLYPIKKYQARKLNYWNKEKRNRRISPYMPYFYKHISYFPHIRLNPPQFDNNTLLRLMTQEHIDHLLERKKEFLDMSLPVHDKSYIYTHELIQETEIYDSIRREKLNA